VSEIWHRVFYRSGRNKLVLGEAELNRAVARKNGGVLHHEIAIVHRCWHCGIEGPWRASWISVPIYGRRYEELKAAGRPYEGSEVYCGLQCWHAGTGGYELPEIFDAHAEPRDVERDQALYRAQWGERDRRRELLAHRRVPMPEWKGRGWCKWCTLIIVFPNGAKKAGQQDRRRNWHPHCLDEYNLHADLDSQAAHCRHRDGPACAWLGCEVERGLELDHRVPLWKVRDLPDHKRLPFYGPGNLWLLCAPHHTAKTSREAGERARERALARAQGDLGLTSPGTDDPQ
jgi:hypothetical protein